MNKSEFIKSVADKSEVTIKDTKKVVDAFEEVLMDVLAKGETVMFPGFGSFLVAERAARTGKNFKRFSKVDFSFFIQPRRFSGPQISFGLRIVFCKN